MRLTLGLGEFILLNAGLDSLVELRVKDTLSSDVDLVISLDILLDSLATITRRYSVSGLFYDPDREHLGRRSQRHQRRGGKKRQETYLLPFRSFSYVQKDQSAMRTNKK